MRETYTIELKIDFEDNTRHDAMKQIAKQYARDLLASAMLLQDGRQPSIAFRTADSFSGEEELKLLDESEYIHNGEA